MAPKKPAKPNGFVIFAMDLQKQHGRKYPSLKDACDAAAPLWARMGKDQRAPYDNRAKELKSKEAPSRYTSEGLDVEQLTREQQLKEKAETDEKEAIVSFITQAYRKGEEVLAKEPFFVIHCNIFCYYPRSDSYWPAEISVLMFNLKDGVKQENLFHSIVDPGRLPIGYGFEAKQHSDETHQLPVPMGDTESNIEEIYFNLKAFLEKKKSPGTKRMPILFADKKYKNMIQNILDSWSNTFDHQVSLFRVYNLQYMFFHLRNQVAGTPVPQFPSVTFSDREIEKDVYAYVPEIACEFHTTTAKPIYCSQSIVQRYAFTICDNCCSDLNIELEPGKHVPIHSSIPEGISTVDSFSTRSSKSSRYGGRGRNFDSDFDTESTSGTWDTESLISNTSSANTITFDDQFPSLGGSRSNSQNSEYYTPNNNSSSVKSYAGATLRNPLPAAFEKSFENITLNSSTGAIPKGRGFRRNKNDSDSDTSSIGPGRSLNSSSTSDFPPLAGRGRGFLPRQLKKPGVETSNN